MEAILGQDLRWYRRLAIGWNGAEVVAVLVSASNVVGGENRAEALFAEDDVTCDVVLICVMSQAASSLE